VVSAEELVDLLDRETLLDFHPPFLMYIVVAAVSNKHITILFLN
jgi:hypothetical protein